jgi:DNA helicase-2/ATP-dependent DNA helicase PcrA
MENGLFPHSRSFDETVEMEEERRLCYVGITRAQTRLFLTSALRRRVYGVEQHHVPSLFLADIPAECVLDYSPQSLLTMTRQPWQTTGHFPAPAVPRTTPAAAEGAPARRPPYAVGSQVFHQQFGRGVVQKREGEGEGLKLTVIFRDHGVKKLLARYAPMQAL